MADRRTNRPSGRAWSRGVWVRAGFLHPAAFVGPWVGLSLLLGGRGERDQRRGVGLLGHSAQRRGELRHYGGDGGASFRDCHRGDRDRVVVLIASATALVLGFIGWLQAADVACHGGYDCPL